jgi:hypothetical protein
MLVEEGGPVGLDLIGHDGARISAWVRRWAPWHSDDETVALIYQVAPKPLKWTADKLAERLGLDYATRTRLGITTIGAVDCKKAKARETAQEAFRRAREGSAGQSWCCTSRYVGGA